ncbi:MAG: hypothetical protein A2Y77_01995 [Planctomycetes bacterium RBG_13_62_9]|nr:MAG: hypothetical protein A2Y77_01995 [Planctomycetes bacterium RBG_13_62_9]
MTLEAPLSRSRRTSFIIYIVACVAMAAWFAYDGYINESFIAEHTGEQGNPDSTLVFNQKAPPFLLGGAALFGICLAAMRGRKLAAEENELVISARERIPYDAIERIDKTHFESKGFFTITYKKDGREVDRKLSDRRWDRLGPLLDHLIAKIT